MSETHTCYGESIGHLLSNSAFDRYGTEQTDASSLRVLESLRLEDLFTDRYSDRTLAKCCLAGIFLLHNQLELSHEISQAIQTSEGCFWHAIVHRIEGDYWNSLYWYRRAGDHPIYRELFKRAADIVGDASDPILISGTWKPEPFVALCERESDEPSAICKSLAVAEWKLLFDFCFRKATLPQT